ncbi:hypothetical protein L686_05845 [Stutzerimonas stutzeri MF28]|nr:hypothetical protein L686_05845 [Stutzerimonas stutzeri MF28]
MVNISIELHRFTENTTGSINYSIDPAAASAHIKNRYPI